MEYTQKEYVITGLNGLSDRQIGEHLKLYAGYVKNTNAIWQNIIELEKNIDTNALSISELTRRFGFEFNGMRLHEYYFESLGAKALEENSTLKIKNRLTTQYGSFDFWLSYFKKAGTMRGIGWVLLTYDKSIGALHTSWVSDHEIGNLAGLPILLAMDVWEHAYLLDYSPSERKNYIEAFFNNLNWEMIEKRFELANK
ncbi:MAG: Fe-Mn family superoxide dismutase [Patescibacteria group bacterium]